VSAYVRWKLRQNPSYSFDLNSHTGPAATWTFTGASGVEARDVK
jgi:hypothetical protein